MNPEPRESLVSAISKSGCLQGWPVLKVECKLNNSDSSLTYVFTLMRQYLKNILMMVWCCTNILYQFDDLDVGVIGTWARHSFLVWVLQRGMEEITLAWMSPFNTPYPVMIRQKMESRSWLSPSNMDQETISPTYYSMQNSVSALGSKVDNSRSSSLPALHLRLWTLYCKLLQPEVLTIEQLLDLYLKKNWTTESSIVILLPGGKAAGLILMLLRWRSLLSSPFNQPIVTLVNIKSLDVGWGIVQ